MEKLEECYNQLLKHPSFLNLFIDTYISNALLVAVDRPTLSNFECDIKERIYNSLGILPEAISNLNYLFNLAFFTDSPLETHSPFRYVQPKTPKDPTRIFLDRNNEPNPQIIKDLKEYVCSKYGQVFVSKLECLLVDKKEISSK